ncbi:MAG TPA: DUF4270 family protein [Hanamia sp.]|nr:DUF4270 family protein [Hanamia sp.]
MFKSQLKAAVTGVLILFFFGYGCTKIDTTNLGQGLIPVVDNIHTFDTTLTVIANNFDDASICDSVFRTDLHALGSISDDPLFGSTNASIYMELKPAAYPFTFPASDPGTLSIDSVVLVLSYARTYGDTNAIQKVEVYPLTANFKVDTNYTTCNTFNYDQNTLLGERFYYPHELTDSIHGFEENAANQLRIPMNPALIQRFISDSAAIFVSDSTFRDYFKGFAIVPGAATGGRALNYFNLSSTDTRLAIYLRSSVAGVKDTSIVNFSFTAYSGEANSVIRQRGSSEITNNLSNAPAGDSLLYVQTSPGSYVKLKIPALSGLSNRVINRAELIVEQEYSPSTFDNILTPPVNLYLDTKDTLTNGKYIPVPCDFSSAELSSNFATMGGSAKTVTNAAGNSVTQYVFNISRYVQSIVTKGSNNDVLRLSAPYYISNQTPYVDRCGQGIAAFDFRRNDVGAGRVKLNGTNMTPGRIRLHIVYSIL